MQKSITLFFVITALALLSVTGCAKQPSREELLHLSEARKAAEAAEKKLAELRAERIRLEATLKAKKEELRKAEEERDAAKAKMGE